MSEPPAPDNAEASNAQRRLKFEEYQGETVEAAQEAARQALGDRLLGTDTIRKTIEKRASARGRTAEEAKADAVGRIPMDGFDRGECTIVQEGQSGSLEVSEKSEDVAYDTAKGRAPKGANIDRFECTQPPSGGVLGIGRKPGTWAVDWSTPFVAEVTYKMPAMVAARFYEEAG